MCKDTDNVLDKWKNDDHQLFSGNGETVDVFDNNMQETIHKVLNDIRSDNGSAQKRRIVKLVG